MVLGDKDGLKMRVKQLFSQLNTVKSLISELTLNKQIAQRDSQAQKAYGLSLQEAYD